MALTSRLLEMSKVEFPMFHLSSPSLVPRSPSDVRWNPKGRCDLWNCVGLLSVASARSLARLLKAWRRGDTLHYLIKRNRYSWCQNPLKRRFVGQSSSCCLSFPRVLYHKPGLACAPCRSARFTKILFDAKSKEPRNFSRCDFVYSFAWNEFVVMNKYICGHVLGFPFGSVLNPTNLSNDQF